MAIDDLSTYVAASVLGAFLVCVRALAELRDRAQPTTVANGEFLVSILLGGIAGAFAGLGAVTWLYGFPADAQSRWSLFVALPCGIVTGEIFSFAALVHWRARGHGAS